MGLDTKMPIMDSKKVILKSSEEITLLQKSAQLVSKTLGVLAKEIKPGIDTLYLDKIDGKQTPSSEHTDLTAKTIDVTLENGTTYFWRIKSFDGTNSSFSAVNTFKTNSTDSGSESNSTSGTNSSQEQVKEVPGNIIKNGTFETGSISPWGGFKNAVISSAAQPPNSGNYLARIEPHDGSIYQVIDLEPGEKYELKFYHRWKDIPENTFKAVFSSSKPFMIILLLPL